MKPTHLLKSIAAAALLTGASLSANASNSTVVIDADTNLATFSGSAPRGPFTDIIEFILPDSTASSYSLIDVPLYLHGFKSTLSGFSLFSNSDGELFNDDDTLLASGNMAANGGGSSFSVGALSAGSYFLQVSGIAKGNSGGIYAGSVSVTPVPEPETYAMLLAGLGVMGAIARRRKVK